MLKNRRNKRPTEEKVGFLAHSVWDVKYLYVVLFSVKWKAATVRV